MRVDRFKRVILITGTPGVGKTAVSRMLADRLNATYLSLAELVEKEKLVSGVDKARGTLIADMDKVSRRVQKLIADSERDVIVEGHYAVNVVPAKDVHLVFVLRRKPEELKKLMEERGYKESKLWENLAAEILDVCLTDAVSTCGHDKVCEIDASGKKIEDVVEEILSVMKNKRKCFVGIVDWLGKLDREGRLQEFLKPF